MPVQYVAPNPSRSLGHWTPVCRSRRITEYDPLYSLFCTPERDRFRCEDIYLFAVDLSSLCCTIQGLGMLMHSSLDSL